MSFARVNQLVNLNKIFKRSERARHLLVQLDGRRREHHRKRPKNQPTTRAQELLSDTSAHALQHE